MITRFKAAAAHAAPVFLDRDATTDKVCRLIAEAGKQDVKLLVFPEVFIPGFPYWINCYPPIVQPPLQTRYAAQSVEVPGPEIARIQSAAEEAGMVVVVGVSERDGGTLYNTQVFLGDGGQLLGKHRKLQPTYAERGVWGQGDGSTLLVWETNVGKLGGLACWEHTMNLARQALILQGEQVHAGSWPGFSTLAGFTDVFDLQVEAMSRNHALTGQCFVVVAENPVTAEMLTVMEEALGPQEFVTAGGGWSAIIHPMTHYLAGPQTGPEERLVAAEIDLDDIAVLKVFVDGAGHYSRPEILRLVVDTEPKTGLWSTEGAYAPSPTAGSEGERPPGSGASASQDAPETPVGADRAPTK